MMTNKTLNVSNNFQVALLNFNSTTTMYMYQLLTNRLCQRYSSSKCLPHLMKIGKLSSYIVVWCILYMVPMSSIDILDPCKKLFFFIFYQLIFEYNVPLKETYSCVDFQGSEPLSRLTNESGRVQLICSFQCNILSPMYWYKTPASEFKKNKIVCFLQVKINFERSPKNKTTHTDVI